ncbi:hypothetical protein S1OALGB6SA_605 [Olavius algarvensis spirochete endosymbiont]|uniref:ABC transporter ATP-binding protein n=1 Tax=Olavius algarvensis spirochete endosymbiont TaxID=260710 RepID=UPI000F0EDB5C|nr:ABC transporter ATP-binding protein [Olavius algarvensis spirochete endosymbiont]VDA99536.1 hypothetical protein S1OALGB6SA_605 [Olavius algarvensis spirochete endosymbiont]
MIEPDAAITINELFFTWPNAESPFFKNLNLRFRKGYTICLIGPNGSGKTSLMELILGWRRADSGYVGIGGRSIASIPSRERGQMMALVPQEERISFSYSVLEYVLLGRAPFLPPLASPGRDDKNYARNSLDRVGISHLIRRLLPSLSGGEKRMVLIARALVQNPRIMLLDEPVNHLDPANCERIIEILIDLKSSGITIVMSSHDPAIVLRLADQVVLLRSHETPVMGSPDKLLTSKNLSELYGVIARVVDVEGRKLILWGK